MLKKPFKLQVSNYISSIQYYLFVFICILFVIYYCFDFKNSSLMTVNRGGELIILWIMGISYFYTCRKGDKKNDINYILFTNNQLIITYLDGKIDEFLYTDINKCEFTINVSSSKTMFDTSKVYLAFTIFLNDGKKIVKNQVIKSGFFRHSYNIAMDLVDCQRMIPEISINMEISGTNDIALEKIKYYREYNKIYYTTSEKILFILFILLGVIGIFIAYDLYFNIRD